MFIRRSCRGVEFQVFLGMVTHKVTTRMLGPEKSDFDDPTYMDRSRISMAAQRDPHDSPAIQAFGILLKKLREAAELKKVHFAEALGYSPQFIGQVESARNTPSKTFAQDLDTYFTFDGLFVELWRLIKGTHRLGTSSAVPRYLELERTAGTIRVFETRVVPELFQTENYARAALSTLMGPEAVEETLRAHDRTALYERRNPPHIFLVLDEDALHRKVGSPEVVREQLTHLLRLSERPEICLQVLSHDTDCYVAYSGSFTVLEFPDEPPIVFIESAGQGSLIDTPPSVATCARRFDRLRGHAHSVPESRAIIERSLQAG
jgi:transcriptional regulator with XRE-family HTH domain